MAAPRHPSRGALIGAVAAVLVLGAVGAVVVVHRTTHHLTPAAKKPVAPPAPLSVTSVLPAAGSTIGFSDDLVVHFSAPLRADVPDPVLAPAVAGSWTRTDASTLEFQPSGYFLPLSTIHLSIAAGRSGPESRAGGALAAPDDAAFHVEDATVLRLQQLLAELNYLPVRFAPAPATPSAAAATYRLPAGSSGAATTSATLSAAIDGEATVANEVAPVAGAGTFSWRFANVPPSLASLWRPGGDTSMLVGAVMAFQSAHNLEANGELSPAFWSVLFSAVANRSVTHAPYDYIEVSETLPETLSVWQNGKVVYKTLANTGISVAPTALGTYPVYARYLSTTMSGYNPDGSHYDDPGVPDVAYFNGGDAVHGFYRPGYGYPQSLGCVELPYSSAPVVYNYDPIGTLVTVA